MIDLMDCIIFAALVAIGAFGLIHGLMTIYRDWPR